MTFIVALMSMSAQAAQIQEFQSSAVVPFNGDLNLNITASADESMTMILRDGSSAVGPNAGWAGLNITSPSGNTGDVDFGGIAFGFTDAVGPKYGFSNVNGNTYVVTRLEVELITTGGVTGVNVDVDTGGSSNDTDPANGVQTAAALSPEGTPVDWNTGTVGTDFVVVNSVGTPVQPLGTGIPDGFHWLEFGYELQSSFSVPGADASFRLALTAN